jgi:hypothetical protein
MDWWGDLYDAAETVRQDGARRLEEAEAMRTGRVWALRELRRALKQAAAARTATAERMLRAAEERFHTQQAQYETRLHVIYAEVVGRAPSAEEWESFTEVFWGCLERPMIEHWWERGFGWIAQRILADALRAGAEAEAGDDGGLEEAAGNLAAP